MSGTLLAVFGVQSFLRATFFHISFVLVSLINLSHFVLHDSIRPFKVDACFIEK